MPRPGLLPVLTPDGWVPNSVSGTSTIPETDALVTTEPGIALAVLTADCVPVLFADAAAGVVAGAHAGRVGAKLGIAR